MFEANFHRLRSILISLDVNEEEGDKLRNDAWCCFLAASILAVVKIWLIRYTPSSALFADDYDSLNRAIFYYGDGLRASVDN